MQKGAETPTGHVARQRSRSVVQKSWLGTYLRGLSSRLEFWDWHLFDDCRGGCRMHGLGTAVRVTLLS